MRILRSLAKTIVVGIVILIAVPVAYVFAAFAGAAIPSGSSIPTKRGPELSREIVLLTTLLHTDIAIKADDAVLEKFDFLWRSTLPLAHPNLKYVGFGWGSRAFYTSAGNYTDITPGAVFKAVTGDDPVMRVVAMGDVSNVEDSIKISLTEPQFQTLLSLIYSSFKNHQLGKVSQLEGISIGPNDAFFPANGHFDIFRPCNVWVGEVLSGAGVGTGIWTPTSQSLELSLSLHGQ
ncbi:MAG: TIGR02117 family protein [Pseudomonadota bacterium]